MRPEDLTNLLQPAPPADVGFRQGVVVSWDPAGGTNEIDVAGTSLTNLPTLSSNEASIFAPGDAVGLLRVRSQYFVLGRIVAPGATSPVQVAGTLGMGDAAFGQWPMTDATTDVELMVGLVQRLGGRLSFAARTYAGPGATGVFQLVIESTVVVTSASLVGGTAGAFGNFTGTVDFPAGINYLDEIAVALTGRVSAGSGDVAVSLRKLQMA